MTEPVISGGVTPLKTEYADGEAKYTISSVSAGPVKTTTLPPLKPLGGEPRYALYRNAQQNRIRQLVHARGLNNPQCAALTKTKVGTLAKYMQGRAPIPRVFVDKLAVVLGASIEWLNTGKGSPYPANMTGQGQLPPLRKIVDVSGYPPTEKVERVRRQQTTPQYTVHRVPDTTPMPRPEPARVPSSEPVDFFVVVRKKHHTVTSLISALQREAKNNAGVLTKKNLAEVLGVEPARIDYVDDEILDFLGLRQPIGMKDGYVLLGS